VCTLQSGCAGWLRQGNSHGNSSLVEYLYPNSKEGVVIKPSLPILSLPLKVGVAFVPENCSSYNRFEFPEQLKQKLMNNISATFLANNQFIEKIEAIQSDYLLRKGGFENLDNIKNAYDIDVIVLLSYDQVQFTSENIKSLVYYYTLVGEYIFKGDKNDTSTLIDAVVYDIDSRKLLFRSSGNSTIKGESTRRSLTEKLRADSAKGFELAIAELNINMSNDLEIFRQKIKDKQTEVKLTYRPTYHSSGGSMDMNWMLLLASVLVTLRLPGYLRTRGVKHD
jgi:rhombotail lipoprotein